MDKASRDRRNLNLIGRLVRNDPDPDFTPDAETAAKWASHSALMARQDEEKRLRAIGRETERKGSLKGLEKLGKKVGKRDQAAKRHEDAKRDIIRRSNRHNSEYDLRW